MPNPIETLQNQRDPLDDTKAENQALLAGLQCNILSGHGQPNTHYFFLTFGPKVNVKAVLRGIAEGELGDVPRELALEPESSSRARRTAKREARVQGKRASERPLSTNLFLTARCYTQFLKPFILPSDAAFRHAMADRDEALVETRRLNDPSLSERGAPPHALYMVGYDPERVKWAAVRAPILAYLEKHGVTVREEAGYVLRHATENYPVEPFGYRDSISQPLFFRSDFDDRKHVEGAAASLNGTKWSSFAPLSLALVPDPNGVSAEAFGSYVVYRKLRQDVAGFYQQAERLADSLPHLPNGAKVARNDVADRLVGRKLDGHPLDAAPDYNDFIYGARSACPVHAHARKVNPRDSYTRGRRIVRRATVYGPKLQYQEDGRPELTERGPVLAANQGGELSGDGVGLMFLCCQADITEQFEAIQGQWSNSTLGGADPVIAQMAPGAVNKIGLYGSGIKLACDPVVTLLEGEYFFAPSIGFFSKL